MSEFNSNIYIDKTFERLCFSYISYRTCTCRLHMGLYGIYPSESQNYSMHMYIVQGASERAQHRFVSYERISLTKTPNF